jgi:pseudaminic acid cytidylyltransferase
MNEKRPLIAVIPARAGSKRITNKNIRNMNGTPLIVRTINTLADTQLFDRIVVSTDSPEIEGIALRAGAEVPYLRSVKLSDDVTPTLPVIKDMILKLGLSKLNPEPILCCVYPASFMLSSKHFVKAFELSQRLIEGQFCISVLEYPHPIQRSFMLNAEMKLIPNDITALGERTQDLPPNFHDAGQFYWAYVNTWLNSRSILASDCLGLILPRFEVVDIDTEEDWRMAEILFQGNKLHRA